MHFRQRAERFAVGRTFDNVVAAINAATAREVFAVDIPCGLDCDTGQPLGPTGHHHTAVVAGLRTGFRSPAAREWLGQVHVVDFGAQRSHSWCRGRVKPPSTTSVVPVM